MLRIAYPQINGVARSASYPQMGEFCMKFDVTKLSYAEIERIFGKLRRTPFYISKFGANVVMGVDAQ